MDFESVYDPTFVADVDKIQEKITELAENIVKLTSKDAVQLDFSIPENPEYYYDGESNTLLIYDINDMPHALELPEKEDGTVDVPLNVTDRDGTKYEINKKDEQLTLERSRNQKITDTKSTIPESDYYTWFIFRKLNSGEAVTPDDVERAVRETPKEKYHQNTVTLDEGRYLCIPVRKRIKYLYRNCWNEEIGKDTISKDPGDFTPYVSSNCTDWAPLTQWSDNPYNRYSIYRTINGNSDTLHNAGYTILDLSEGTHAMSVRRYQEGGKVFCDSILKPDTFIRMITYKGDLTVTAVGKKDVEAVWFERDELTYDGSFGFDRYDEQTLSAFKDKYAQDKFDMVKSDGTKIEYYPPYISAWTNQTVTVKAKIHENQAAGDSVYCKFEADPGLIIEDIRNNGVSCKGNEFIAKNGNYELDVILKSDAPKATLTVKNKTGKTIGKVIFYGQKQSAIPKEEKIKYKTVNVTFGNGVSVPSPYADGASLTDALNNRSFNQSFMQFQNDGSSVLTIDSALIVKSGIKFTSGQLDSEKENRTAIQTLLESEYRKTGKKINKNERIFFLINNQQMTGVGGYAPAPDNNINNTGYSIVIFKSNIGHWESFVHETGHTFGLQHPFDSQPYRQGSTSNFMDYTPKMDMFWKWQWNIISNNKFK
jgi:hypothetical protein